MDMILVRTIEKLIQQLVIFHLFSLTAKGMTEDRIKGYKMGCKAYLGKPFDPEELVAIIDNILSCDRKNINKHY